MGNKRSAGSGSSAPVALVTGSGAPRIGNCVVRALARHGHRVVLHANQSLDEAQQTAQELQTAGTETLVVAGDVRREADVASMIGQTLDHFGRIDVLVNCAAIWQSKPLEEVSADDVREHFEVNTLGTFLCCQHAGLAMTRQTEGGVIVNFGDWAIARPYRDYAAYFPSKGAIPALTRTMAIELAVRNPKVRVNAILPGPAMLPDDLSAQERAEIVSATLLKREGSPIHIAQAVLFLVQNDFVTGVCLPVDGGRSIYAP